MCKYAFVLMIFISSIKASASSINASINSISNNASSISKYDFKLNRISIFQMNEKLFLKTSYPLYNYQVNIYNMIGNKIVFFPQTKFNSGLNINNFKKGMYIISVKNINTRETSNLRFIKF